MTLDEIIHELRSSASVPKEALRAGVAKAEIMRPRITELARKFIDGIWLLPDDVQLLLRGLFVLAAAKDTQSWPVLNDLLKLPEEDIDRLIGNGASETSARLVLSLWDGDADNLLAFAAGRDVGWQARWGAFQALARLVFDRRLDRAAVVRLLERFECEGLMPEDSLAWLGWEDAVAHLGLVEQKPALKRVWATKSVFTDYRDADRAETLRVLEAAVDAPNDPHELDRARIMAIDDPVEALEWQERQNAFDIEDRLLLGAGDADAAGLSASDFDWLEGFLRCAQVPETTMSIEMLDGFLTALIAGPDVVRPSDYLSAIWGEGDSEPQFDSEAQGQFFFDILMRRWNAIAEGILIGAPVAPIVVDYRDDLVGREWAEGFLVGLDFHGSLVRSGKDGKRLERLIDPIIALVGPELYGRNLTASRRDKILDALPTTILQCAAALRPDAISSPDLTPVRATKVGRNDPCPCGSGKKFKKCCGDGAAGLPH